jgi:hypothetical protein
VSVRLAGALFALLLIPVLIFQLALAAGAPLGALAMGGAYEGVLPAPLRVAAVVQALVLTGAGAVVLAKAGLLQLRWTPRRLVWAVVGLMALAAVLNLITPSAGERALWAPVAVGLFLSSLWVAARR